MNREQIKKDFVARLEARGQTINGWARDAGFSPVMVHHVLDGRVKGRFGQAFQIAVRLGIKPKPPTDLAA